jgi:hypothetical protein
VRALSFACLRATCPQPGAIDVPLRKLKTDRRVAVDWLLVTLLQRLRFFRSLDPLPPDGRLLSRPSTKEAFVRQLRDYRHQVCHSLGLSTRIVPHPFRHPCATEDASRWGWLSRADEITRPHFAADDDALCRGGDGGSSAGIATGSFSTSAPRSSAESAPRPPANGPRRGHRLFARRSTCAGDVPARAAVLCCTPSPRPALQPPHQEIVAEARKLDTP